MREVPKECRATLKTVLGAAVVALFAGGSIVLGEYFRVSQGGFQFFFTIASLFVLPALAALAAVPVSLCFCVVPRFRRVAFRVFLASVFFSGVMIASVRIGRFVRM